MLAHLAPEGLWLRFEATDDEAPCPAGTVRVAETWIAEAAGWPFEPDRPGVVLVPLP